MVERDGKLYCSDSSHCVLQIGSSTNKHGFCVGWYSSSRGKPTHPTNKEHTINSWIPVCLYRMVFCTTFKLSFLYEYMNGVGEYTFARRSMRTCSRVNCLMVYNNRLSTTSVWYCHLMHAVYNCEQRTLHASEQTLCCMLVCTTDECGTSSQQQPWMWHFDRDSNASLNAISST